ncbi:uncharacterized protein VTP21DRAFT_2945 [Calcarisporiella thermophila]|uniref:uncharacterized protein n=1 Tax=Calcarisporiella thermophila TaxID=911321 RepID=UPI0037429039
MTHHQKQTKPSDIPIDAGTQPDEYYDKVLFWPRAWARRCLVPLVRAETDILARFQRAVRYPVLDDFFMWTANLGTHTFFMVMLPLLFWFGYSEYGRGLVMLSGCGVILSSLLKDFLCLPRPFAPPLIRLSLSSSTSAEYGFPSTHSTNSVSISLFFLSHLLSATSSPSPFLVALIAFYCFSVVFGRLYCGMHSLTDVIGGITIGAGLWALQLKFHLIIENFLFESGWGIWAPLFFVAAGLLLVWVHPDPVDRCPCFEDSVCFTSVIFGVLGGSWYFAKTPYAWSTPTVATVPYDVGAIGVAGSVMRIVFGIIVLFIWRLVAKKACYFLLPPIYRSLNLPHRNFEVAAKDYRSLHDEPIGRVPSVIHLPELNPDAPADERDFRKRRQSHSEKHILAAAKPNGFTDSVKGKPVTANGEDKRIGEDIPLRYDVDIVTKLIVYAGIGWHAVCTIPVLFELIPGLSVRISMGFA